MTFFQFDAPQPGQSYEYPSLGFVAADGAILDGDASTPKITSAPGPEWSVVASGPESGITRYHDPEYDPSFTEPADGSMLVYSDQGNAGKWTSPADLVSSDHPFGVQLNAAIGLQRKRRPSRVVQPAGAVCFTWDDTWASHDTVRQMADARDQRHSFFIQTDQIDIGGRLTSEQIGTAFDNGHEIVSHTVDHASLSSLTAAQAAAELDDSKTALEAIVGAGNVTSFGYPAGMNGRNATTDQLAWLRYERLFSTGAISNGGVGNSSPYIVDMRNRHDLFVIGRINWTPDTHAYVLQLIRLAAVRPVIVILYGHDLDGTGAPSTANVAEGLDLAESLGVPAITCSEAFPSAQQIADPSFEDAALAAWTITNTTAGNLAESQATAPATGVSGTRALHLNAANGGNVQAAQMVPIVPGSGYTFSALAKIAAGGTGTAYLRVREFDYNGTVLSSQQSASITATTWTAIQYQRTQLANAKAAYALVELIANGAGGPIEAWFDHAQFSASLATGVYS